MSTLTVEQTTLEGLEPEQTLNDVIVGVWTGLSSHQSMECPLCHGEMTPVYAAQALPVGGRCTDCGAALS